MKHNMPTCPDLDLDLDVDLDTKFQATPIKLSCTRLMHNLQLFHAGSRLLCRTFMPT